MKMIIIQFLVVILFGLGAKGAAVNMSEDVKVNGRDGRFIHFLGFWTKNTLNEHQKSGFNFNFGLGPAVSMCE